MLKSVRTGVAVAFLFTSLATAGGLILNPRFVDHFTMGVVLLWILPLLGGAAAGLCRLELAEQFRLDRNHADPPRVIRRSSGLGRGGSQGRRSRKPSK